MKSIFNIEKRINSIISSALIGILSLFSIAYPITTVFSQDITFRKVPEFDLTELGYGGVTDITQDPEGYLWFVTLNGLYRFDGYQVITYRTDTTNPQSIANNWLNTVYADEEGLIWIGTFGKGMDCLDPKTGIFRHYTHTVTDNKSICSDTVTMIRGDKRGFLWVGTNNGLNYFDVKNGKFTHYLHKDNDPNSISDNQIRVIYKDKKGTMWFGTRSVFKSDFRNRESGGLNRFNPKSSDFTRYLNDPGNLKTLIDNRVTAIFEDSRGTFWVGTAGDGLHTMNRETGTFERHMYDKKHLEKLSRPLQRNIIEYADDYIAFINEDATKKIWIGTFTGGINVYDPLKKTTSFIDVSKDTTSKLESWCFTSFISRDGIFWIAPWLGSLYNGDSYFKELPFVSYDEQLNGIVKEDDKAVWLYGQYGLKKKKFTTGSQSELVDNQEKLKDVFHNEITYISVSKNKSWWVTTMGGGLYLYNPRTSVFINYKHDQKNDNSIGSDSLHIVYEEGKNIWIGTQHGLDLLNTTTGKFSHFILNDRDPTNLGNVTVMTIHEKDRKTVWMGTGSSRGMSVLDRSTGKIQKHYLEGKFVTYLLKDHRGAIWATTDDGLYQYNPGKDDFFRFKDPNRFAKIGFSLNIVEDNRNNLWVRTYEAIYKINSSRNSTYIYESKYKVSENNRLYWQFATIPKDELLFISKGGFFSFKADELKNSVSAPQINFGDLEIAGDSTGIGNTKQKVGTNQRELVLAYRQNTFSIAFTPIHFGNPVKNKTIFKLDNVDTDWRESGNERKAYYFNLPPGTYTFHVKACNYNGIWSERQLTITITPPWWRTWWAYVLYVLAVGYAVRSLVAYRSRELQRKNLALEEKVRALEEVKAALLNGQKLERRRVAADLHDNLGGMMSAIRLTIEAMDSSQLSQKEQYIYQNVLGMTQQAYNEVRLLSHNLQPAELEQFGLREALHRLINKLNNSQLIRFSLITNSLERLSKELEFNLYSICLELANNIVKHSGATEAAFEFVTKDEQLQLFVTDNGKGFITDNTSDGMGMRNVQERTEQMGGSLTIHSRPGEGTLFQFTIPFIPSAHA